MDRLLLFGLLGLVASLINGALGMGYGAITSSFLLSAGTAPALASAMVHFAKIGIGLASGAAHWHFGNVDWRTVRIMALPGATGAFCGAVLLSSIPASAAKPLMATILFLLGLYVMLRFALPSFARKLAVLRENPDGRRLPWYALGPLGGFAGFMDATGGAGWGPVGTPALLLSGRMEPRKVVGSIDTGEFLVALGASLGFLIALPWASLELALIGALLAGGLVAAPIAAWLVRHLPARILGTAVGGVIVLTNARTFASAVNVPADARLALYASLVAIAVAALAAAVAAHRREAAQPA